MTNGESRNQGNEMEKYAQENWTEGNQRFYCSQNGHGHWWPCMEMKGTEGGSWYPIIIRNSTPFKTLKGAIKFVEATRERIAKRKAA